MLIIAKTSSSSLSLCYHRSIRQKGCVLLYSTLETLLFRDDASYTRTALRITAASFDDVTSKWKKKIQQRMSNQEKKTKKTPPTTSSWEDDNEEDSSGGEEEVQPPANRRIRTIQRALNAPLPMESPPWLEGDKSGIYDLLMRNREWAETKHDEFRPLSEGQSPKYFVICCSDSRCPSERLMGFKTGECFTVRNIGNCVMSGDLYVSICARILCVN